MYTFRGLPLHPLVVHAVVVLLPLTAVCVVLHAVWPPAARRLGIVTPLLGVASVILVPLAVSSGEHFAAAFGTPVPPLIERHEQLAERLLPWTIGLAVVAVLVWAATRWSPARVFRIGVAALALVAAVGTAVTVAQVGEAGSRAVWSGVDVR
jgi:hypothetical protein